MFFAQFYIESATNSDRLIPACGDRGVIIMDGRRKLGSQIDLCREHAERTKKNYVAFAFFRGETILRCARLRGVGLIAVDPRKQQAMNSIVRSRAVAWE